MHCHRRACLRSPWSQGALSTFIGVGPEKHEPERIGLSGSNCTNLGSYACAVALRMRFDGSSEKI